MKFKSFVFAAAACVVAAACGQKVSDTTVISGSYAEEPADSVTFSTGGEKIATVPVVDGKFTAELPADATVMYTMTDGAGLRSRFISDGTPLTIEIAADKGVTITSMCPKISVQAKNDAFTTSLHDLWKTYKTLIDSLGDEKKDSLYDAYDVDYNAINEKVISENNDNVIAITAIQNMMYSKPVKELDSLLGTLAPSLDSNKVVAKMKQTVAAQLATDEGKPFTDFEVNGVKFSEYVGQGKYMLVDFWASWCGPCKREIPNVKNVYEKYAGEDFDVLSVAVWDKPQATIDTAKVYGIKWSQIVDAQHIPTDLYGIQGIPHIILFGPDGTILKRDLREAAIEEEVAKYVQPKK